jgi:hypothetical protein
MKVTPVKIVDTGRITKKGDKVIEITTQCGKTGSGFDEKLLSLELNKESELDVSDAPDYNNEKRYYFKLPSDNKGFPRKDYTFDKRKASLDAAIAFATGQQKKADSKEIVEVAKWFYQYLNEK